ncbi:MAG: polyprenyl synthetase family protein [Succinivibrio sp.]|nr:polyprenyl synthetase family protein [Succinivibrio sp.]
MEDLEKLLAPWLKRVEELLFTTINDDQTEQHVNALCLQVIKAGGKRIRPKLCLLCGQLLPELISAKTDEENLCKCAAAVELLHTATLIHDDVIDKASTRRGQATLNETEGNHAAVLAGDYMLARNFLLMQDLKSFEVFRAAGETTASLVGGELNQLARQGDLTLSEDDYRQTIYCKTGALFSLAASIFAISKDAESRYIKALTTYGTQLGIAFQVTDDMLDYTSSESSLGKPVGEDLSDLRITLPLIYTRSALAGKEQDALTEAVSHNDFATVKDLIARTGALSRCESYAQQAAMQAIAALEVFADSPYRRALTELCQQVLKRRH